MAVTDRVLQYFNGDEIAASAWASKYQMKDPSKPNDNTTESTPDEMHLREAKEFARIEYNYKFEESARLNKNTTWHEEYDKLSEFGKKLLNKRLHQDQQDIVQEFYQYFSHFNQIVPQGSIMSNLGNHFIFGSLSNCFVISPPLDSYGGLIRTDEEMAQLMKRRGGVGTHLNNIRPTLASVLNASRTSTGVPTYAERYSNTTREVAQEGRRGALMLLLLVVHPDIFRFTTMKIDRSKVTGANVSIMFTDEFMQAVENDTDFLCRFPVDITFPITTTIKVDLSIGKESFTTTFEPNLDLPEYNNLYSYNSNEHGVVYLMKIRAKEFFDLFVHTAWASAEPGMAFIDRVVNYCPDGVYEEYVPVASNPCAEQWLPANDTCRLIATNFFGIVKNPFTDKASIDYDKLYEISYMQQRLGDNLVDLEAEYIDRIIEKIIEDPEPDEIKHVELELWHKIRDKVLAGRRTGSGFTALGDMLAAYDMPYYSPEIVEKVMKTKMRAELDCTIDMAILRGTFKGWDSKKEYKYTHGESIYMSDGKNAFFEMLATEFPEQAKRMYLYGRRNVSWSTVAPTGTVSLMTGTTSGLEPLFEPYYIRRKKINANDTGSRVDFVDGMGDKWQEFAVIHPKFKEWIIVEDVLTDEMQNIGINNLSKDVLQMLFAASPWYGSTAKDLSWEQRIEINSIIQKYTTNAISCTVNLPESATESEVYNIYFNAWKAGLKGITIYRDKSRTGVLVTEVKQVVVDEFGYLDAPERPKELEADYFYLKVGGKSFAILVGKYKENTPYELFGFANPARKENTSGKLIKVNSGHYKFVSNHYTIDNVQLTEHPDEALVCRFVSSMLRHRMHPKYIAEQVDKVELSVVSFGKAVQRVLKSYLPDEEINGEECPECHQQTIVRKEGCLSCSSCGYSKC